MRKIALIGLLIALGMQTATASTLDTIKNRGVLKCGVTQGLAGFSVVDDKGNWTGLDVDYCRALATAIFNDPSKVEFRPTSSKERFTLLQSGEIDVLARVTTWNMSRDVNLGFQFLAVNYYDGQGFMVRKDSGVKSIKDLDGASICTNSGTTTERNISDYFTAHGMSYKPVIFEKSSEVKTAYDDGRCDAYSSDASGLYVQRLLLKDPDANVVLPEVISKEPLAPLVREEDVGFIDLGRWTQFCMIDAEELGVTKENINEMLKTDNPAIRRLLGLEENGSKNLGVGEDFCANIIQKVGNYGEIFAKDVGKDSPLKINRGLNKLWNQGGIMYAPPLE